MKYPWIAEAIMDWGIDLCKYKGSKINCNDCKLRGKICKELSELAIIISDKLKEED